MKTFRRLAANDFTPVFAAPGFGLVKTGSSFRRTAFDAAVSPMTPGGGTPLADALLDVHATVAQLPFGGLPTDERRYVAMLTDGLLTAGAPFSSIPNGSLGPAAVFAMGFGTGAEVDYATLQTMVDKGVTLTTQQVFHGENAGTIDKFYTRSRGRSRANPRESDARGDAPGRGAPCVTVNCDSIRSGAGTRRPRAPRSQARAKSRRRAHRGDAPRRSAARRFEGGCARCLLRQPLRRRHLLPDAECGFGVRSHAHARAREHRAVIGRLPATAMQSLVEHDGRRQRGEAAAVAGGSTAG